MMRYVFCIQMPYCWGEGMAWGDLPFPDTGCPVPDVGYVYLVWNGLCERHCFCSYSPALKINGKLLAGLKLEKTSSRSRFFRGDLTRACFHSSWKYLMWRDLFTENVNMRRGESRRSLGAISDLVHSCIVDLMIASSVSWQHPLTEVGKKGTFL